MMKLTSSQMWDIPAVQITTRNIELIPPLSLPIADKWRSSNDWR